MKIIDLKFVFGLWFERENVDLKFVFVIFVVVIVIVFGSEIFFGWATNWAQSFNGAREKNPLS